MTGVGSLPFHDPAEALALVRRSCPALPFWPQLPRRSAGEGMTAQFLEPAAPMMETSDGVRFSLPRGQRGRVLDALEGSDGSLTSDRAAGFHAFHDALDRGDFADALALKAQVTGPLTLGVCVVADGVPLAEDPAALRVLTDYVARQACWQVRRLARPHAPVLVMVDEPCLSLAATLPGGTAAAVEALAEIFAHVRVAGGRAGVHCCAPLAPALLCEPEPDAISFDAHRALEAFAADAAVRAFVQRGGWLAPGLIPTRRDPAGISVAEPFTRWLLAGGREEDAVRLARQSIVTASCGLGLVPPSAARASFRAAGRLGARLRRMAGE